MIKIIGNSPRKVELRDLNDNVYYKQQKIFSDAEYNRSKDLQKEIKKGSLTILYQNDERDADFGVPGTIDIQDQPRERKAPSSPEETSTILKKINDLETSLKNLPDRAPSNSTLVALSEKVKTLENELEKAKNQGPSVDLTEQFKKLEEKIEKSSNSEDIFKRLETILEKIPSGYSVGSREKREETNPDEVYVPKVSVEDANTHIKLDVRAIEKSDSVSDSLKKLKELKNKNSNK